MDEERPASALERAANAALDADRDPTTWRGIDLTEFNESVYAAQEAEKQAALARELQSLRLSKVGAVAGVAGVLLAIVALFVAVYAVAVTLQP